MKNLLNKPVPTGLDFNRLNGVRVIIDRVNRETGFWLEIQVSIVRAIADLLSLNNGPQHPSVETKPRVALHPTRALCCTS